MIFCSYGWRSRTLARWLGLASAQTRVLTKGITYQGGPLEIDEGRDAAARAVPPTSPRVMRWETAAGSRLCPWPRLRKTRMRVGFHRRVLDGRTKASGRVKLSALLGKVSLRKACKVELLFAVTSSVRRQTRDSNQWLAN